MGQIARVARTPRQILEAAAFAAGEQRAPTGPVLQPRLAMDILTWILVGLVAGTAASFILKGFGYGLVGNIVLGIVGAFVGGWGFRKLHLHSPIEGLAGVIFVAFLGACALLFVIDLVNRSRRTRSRRD
jgi:uncharacterized membrane protein YeaQ/YmgE (transglycosylase-associated protein family)